MARPQTPPKLATPRRALIISRTRGPGGHRLALLAVLIAAAIARSSGPLIGATPLTPAPPEVYNPQNATFAADGAMVHPRYDAIATLLASGDVLITGGLDPTGVPVAEAELYDPGEATFTASASLVIPRAQHSATLLGHGGVLIAGGIDSSGNALSAAELYDPSMRTFEPTGAMNNPRAGHRATELADGDVLVAGGIGGSGALVAVAELYSPPAAVFSPVGSMIVPRSDHSATLLADGSVLMAGGIGASEGPVPTAEVYDPATATFAPAGTMISPRIGHTATLLSDGTVLIVGGTDADGAPISGAELYDPATAGFKAAASLITARTLHTATLLPDGTVLIAGGIDGSGHVLASAEIYDPARAVFEADGAMQSPHVNHAAAMLPSGDVLIVGGTLEPAAPLATPVPSPTPTVAPTPTPTASPTPKPSPVAAELMYSPTRLVFPTQVVIGGRGGVSKPLMVVISNPRTRQQSVAVAIEGYSTSGDFSVDQSATTCTDSLPAGAKCKVAVVFSPSQKGKNPGSLDVITNAAKGKPVQVALNGAGRKGTLNFKPTALNFGRHKLKSAAIQILVIKNTNPVPVTISAIEVSSDGTEFKPLIPKNGCVGMLAANSRCGVSVAFVPHHKGLRQTMLTVTDNAAGSPQAIMLTGFGR